MKRILLLIIIICPIALFSQVDWGFGGGIHSIDVNAKDILYKDKFNADSFSLKFLNAGYGYHFGLLLRININQVFIQPEVMFNSNSNTYNLRSINSAPLLDSIKKERYNYIDIPLMIGLKLGILRLNAGPVGHFFISSKSDLFDVKGYVDNYKSATFGYQAGIGLDIKAISLDVRHEGNFSKFGDHIEFFGEKFNFDSRPTRLIGTLSIRF
jgi:hypothetical protein